MSKLLIVDEHHYYRTPDGKIWISSQNDYNFWKRYLNVFNNIKVIGRIKDLHEKPNNMLLSSGPNVEFYQIPDFTGPLEFAQNLITIRKKLKEAHIDCSHAIFRLPSELSFNMYKNYSETNKPFAVEILIDPWDALAPGTTKNIVRPLVRRRWHYLVKKMCMEANGAAYVTENILQKRYPCKAIIKDEDTSKYFTSHYSSINMSEDFLFSQNNIKVKGTYTISHVGTMQNFVKGQDVLLKAIKSVRDSGYNVNCVLIGDGNKRILFEQLSNKLGISEHVKFTGSLPGSEAVRNFLIKTDMFIYPTKAEGLPRALIEAMACSLPSVSSPVDGVPELLSSEFLVDYNDYEGFAAKIKWLIDNPEIRRKESMVNYNIAKKYTSDILERRRTAFYQNLENLKSRI